MELSFLRTFAPGNESSIDGTFDPENFRSMELSFLRPSNGLRSPTGVTKHRTGLTDRTGRKLGLGYIHTSVFYPHIRTFIYLLPHPHICLLPIAADRYVRSLLFTCSPTLP